MKKTIKLLSLALAAGLLVFACNKSGYKDYKKTESGLYYKFINENKNGQAVQLNDILVGELRVEIEGDSVPLFDNFGHPNRVEMVRPSAFVGDQYEGYLMMHTGEEASFAVPADSVVKVLPQLAGRIEPGKGTKIIFTLKIESIISKDDFEKELAAEEQKAVQAEQESIKTYLETHKIKQEPTASGLYIISKKKGKGAKAVAGKKVKMNYVGSFLTGKAFDTSYEKVAKEQKIYEKGREPYEPLGFTLGQGEMIPGVDEAVATMNIGDVIDVVIPSNMAYGPRGRQPLIPPYTPLLFSIELMSVE